MMNRIPPRTRRLAAAVLILLIAGCAAGTSLRAGRIVPDTDVTRSFERYEINPDYTYFISGSDSCPNALMGLKRGISLGDSLWKPFPATPETFKDTIRSMQDRARVLNLSQHGFILQDGGGRAIGVWYSLISAPTAIRQRSDGSFLIYTPDMDTYQRFRRGD